MNPDDRLREAVKQSEIAADADEADVYAERMIDNATDLLERAGRRLERQRNGLLVEGDS
jgi:ribosome-associated translation inhibitor RaiA